MSGSKVTGTVNLAEEGKDTIELPLVDGSVGPKVVDIRKLYAQTGHFTYDPGFTSTASCDSAITYIDGDQGVLMHRGYKIEELAASSDYMEVCYLLLKGELPTEEEKTKFSTDITYHTMLHEQLIQFFRGFRRDAHPMAVMVGVVIAATAITMAEIMMKVDWASAARSSAEV